MKKVLISLGEMVTVNASSPQLRHLLLSEINTQTATYVKGMIKCTCKTILMYLNTSAKK